MIATILLSRCLLRPVAPYGSLAEVYLRQKMPKSWKGLPWRRSGPGIYSWMSLKQFILLQTCTWESWLLRIFHLASLYAYIR
jgi:hypothetical protein